MNANLLEKGNRTKLIKISCSDNLIKSGNIINIINGNINSNNTWFNANKYNMWIKFKFPMSVIVSKIIWYQNVASENGVWALHGSNDDNNYTLIKNGLVLGKDVISEFDLSLNQKRYTYYKLIQTGGSTYNGPYVQEIEFKLSSKFYVINKDNCNYIISNDGNNIISTDLNLINNNGFNDLSLMNPNVFKYISSGNYSIIYS